MRTIQSSVKYEPLPVKTEKKKKPLNSQTTV